MYSRYIAPFKDGVQSWVNKLSTVSDVLEQWIQVQAMWLYLEAVFTSGDIAKQLPQESKRFQVCRRMLGGGSAGRRASVGAEYWQEDHDLGRRAGVVAMKLCHKVRLSRPFLTETLLLVARRSTRIGRRS